MNQKLHDLLSRLTGHIATGPLSEDKILQSLHHSLSKSLLPEDVLQLKSNTFQFESADFLSPSRVPTEISHALEGIIEQQASPTADLPAYRVFLREVGIRSVQIPGAVPSWAAGSAVDHTLGPFTNIDGRLHWYDFYQIQRLVTLYIGTLNEPALLFDVDVGLHLFHPRQAFECEAGDPVQAGGGEHLDQCANSHQECAAGAVYRSSDSGGNGQTQFCSADRERQVERRRFSYHHRQP